MINNGNNIQIKKIELAELLFREKKTKSQVESYKQTLSKLEEIKALENAERNNEADPIFQPELYKIQKNISSVSKEIENLKKKSKTFKMSRLFNRLLPQN